MKLYIDAKDKINDNALKEASNLIRNGELVIFPTETVYGIGANGLDAEACKKIFTAKGRVSDNPLILHVSNVHMIKTITKNITKIEKKLIDTYFPGPLTIIFNKSDIVPPIVTGGLDTVGVRMPSNEIANKLISYAQVPIAAPSANISGRPSGTYVNDIIGELENKVSCIINGGDTDIGLESTVIKVENDEIIILRPGKITLEDFQEKGFNARLDENIFKTISKNDTVLSPGMKYKHYAPKKKCLLIYSPNFDKFIEKVNELEKDNNLVVVCRKNNINKFKNAINMGETLEEISHNIFHILREIDNTSYDLVVIEGVKKEKLGTAIMNRLIRACSHNYIEFK